MPIDFAAIASEFRPLLTPRVNDITRSLERLGKWLEAQLRRTRAMVAVTAHYPVLGFYNDALMVWVDPGQYGALGVAPDHPSRRGETLPDFSPLGRLVEAGKRFWDGLKQFPDVIEQELALPRLLGALAGIAEAIANSMDKFARPFRDMFSISTGHTGSDLFGELALLWRSVTHPLGMRDIALTGLGAAFLLGTIRSLFPAGGESGGGGDILTLMAQAVQGIAGTLALLPTLAATLSATFDTAILAVKIKLLREVQDIEASVHGIRRQVIDLFYVDLASLGPTLFDYVDIAGEVILANLNFYSRFVHRWLRDSIPDVIRFGGEFLHFLLEAIKSTVKAVVNWTSFFDDDFWGFLEQGLLGSRGALFDDAPPLTIGEFLDMISGGSTASRREEVKDYVSDLAGSLRYVPKIRPRILALERLLGTPPLRRLIPFETTIPEMPKFPDLFQVWFGAGRPDFPDLLDRALTPIRTNFVSSLKLGVGVLETLSKEFREGAAKGAMLPRRRLDSASAYGTEMAERWFGGERASLAERIAAGRTDPLLALASVGGFSTMGVVIPRYIEGMHGYWRDRLRETPTSPLILARRRKLTVKVPTLKIDARGEAIDESLIQSLRSKFKEAVEAGYRKGALQTLKLQPRQVG